MVQAWALVVVWCLLAYPAAAVNIFSGQLAKGKDLGFQVVVPEAFEISFTLVIPSQTKNFWRNVLHIGGSASGGDRNPAFWIRPNSLSFHVRLDTSARGNEGFDTVAFSPGTHDFVVRHVPDLKRYSMLMDGVEIGSTTLGGEFTSGKNGVAKDVWVSDRFYESLGTQMTNLEINELGTKKPTVQPTRNPTTARPTEQPTTASPTYEGQPTSAPSRKPTLSPTSAPSATLCSLTDLEQWNSPAENLQRDFDLLLKECNTACNITYGSISEEKQECFETCHSQEAGITAPCSACFRDFSMCLASNCKDSCDDGSGIPSRRGGANFCLSCSGRICNNAFEECTKRGFIVPKWSRSGGFTSQEDPEEAVGDSDNKIFGVDAVIIYGAGAGAGLLLICALVLFAKRSSSTIRSGGARKRASQKVREFQQKHGITPYDEAPVQSNNFY